MPASSRLLALALAALLGLTSACGDDGDDANSTADANNDDSDNDGDNDDNGSGTGDGVDVCAIFTPEDFEEIMGVPVAEESGGSVAEGSLLGECSYTSDQLTTVSVSARPAGELESTVETLDLAEVDVPGAQAFHDDTLGMVVLFDGQPYLLQIIAFDVDAIGVTEVDTARAIAGRIQSRL